MKVTDKPRTGAVPRAIHQAARLPLRLEMFCLFKPFMQNHLCVFPAFVFSRELFSSFKRLGNTLLLKCSHDAAEFTFLLLLSLARGAWGPPRKLSRAVFSECSAPPGQALQLPGAHLESGGHKACTFSSTSAG